MSRRRPDRTLIVAGLVTAALGTLLLLDTLKVIDLRFGYTAPALLVALGAVLLTAGLTEEGVFRPPVTGWRHWAPSSSEGTPATSVRRHTGTVSPSRCSIAWCAGSPQ
jgi:uncharacterized membrane protein YhhN